MGKKIFLVSALAMIVLTAVFVGRATATGDYDGQIIRMEGLDTLYYVADGRRYVFPNEKIYKTWFLDFTDIITLLPSQIYGLPLAGNVLYRPGVLMVKITTDPKVYAVSRDGVLRHVTTEALARKLYGQNWHLLVDDVPDSYFTNYTVGDPIDDTEDYDAAGETEDTDSIEANRGLALGHAKKAQTAKCRAISAVPATPGVSSRECHVLQDDDNGAEPDTEEPVISNATATTTTSTATVSWKTDELATGEIKYALESLATATTSAILIVSSAATTTAHSLGLIGLTASTTYFYKIWSTDLAAYSTSTPETTFTTLSE